MSNKQNKINIIKIGDYDLYSNNQINNGKYSCVYLGKCTNEDIIKLHNLKDGLVAIKKINHNNLSNKTKNKLEDEIEIMKFIKNNPNDYIIKCIDVYEYFNATYIIMGYCSDGDLSNIIGLGFEETIAKRYFIQIVHSLQYLNENKIIHCDLKPKNILLTNDYNNIKICDFGLSILKDKFSNYYCGSPLYMSPEILNQNTFDNSADLWSLGIILFELIFGYNPFCDSKDIDELKQNITQNINFPFDISEECKDLINKLLNINKNKRIQLNDILKHKWIINDIYTINKKSNKNQIDNYLNNSNNSPDMFSFEL